MSFGKVRGDDQVSGKVGWSSLARRVITITMGRDDQRLAYAAAAAWIMMGRTWNGRCVLYTQSVGIYFAMRL